MQMPNTIIFRYIQTTALISVCLFLVLAATGCQCGQQQCPQQCGQQPFAPQQFGGQQFGAQQFGAQQFGGQQFNPQQFNGQQFNAQQFNAQPSAAPGFGSTAPNFTNTVAAVGGNSATIAAPGTYTLNIPGGRGVNPFANPSAGSGTRVGQLPNGLLNTSQAAPTPATGPNSPSNFNQRQGWRSGNGSNLNTQTGNTNSANGNQVATSVLDRSGSSGQNAASTVPTLARNNNVPAPAPTRPLQNLATTVSTDYRTTSIDERQDSTRLPVTDASRVQPVSRVAENAAFARQQPYYQPNQMAAAQNFQGTFAQPANSAYQGTFQNPAGSFSAPLSQPQLVQAQSTATYNPYSSTASDWRNREGQTQY